MSNKFRKPHTITHTNDLIFKQRQGFTLSSYGIRVLESFDITKKQILQYRALVVKILKALNRTNDRYYKGLHYSSTPNTALHKLNAYHYNSKTAKSQGSRMGKGKGAVEDYYYPLQAGSILIELGNIGQATAEQCLFALKHKIPVPIRLVSLTY